MTAPKPVVTAAKGADFMATSTRVTPRQMPIVVASVASLVMAFLAVAPAAAARPQVTVDRNLHFETVQHFPAGDCGPGSTEIATGNSHLIVVDDGTTLHVQFMETFKVRMIWDDDLFPEATRQGTDALHFNLNRNGTETFHESFHDFGPAPFADGADMHIQLFVTFVAKDGDVKVDHFMGRDLPPEGC